MKPVVIVQTGEDIGTFWESNGEVKVIFIDWDALDYLEDFTADDIDAKIHQLERFRYEQTDLGRVARDAIAGLIPKRDFLLAGDKTWRG